jgi:hypothetical protein
LDGARAAARDVDRQVRAHVSTHLKELVQAREADGQIVAERINSAAADLIAAYAEYEAVAGGMGMLLTQVTRPGPEDVTRSRPETDAAVKAAIALINLGGEEGPRLDRRRSPWNTLLDAPGVEDEAEPVDLTVVT